MAWDMQLQACSLYILNLYASLKAALAVWDPKTLLPNTCIPQMCQSGLVKGSFQYYKSYPFEKV